MTRLLLGLVMLLAGLVGLACTACGVVFLPANAIGLIGIIPGALLLWLCVVIWKRVFASQAAPVRGALESSGPSRPDGRDGD